MRRVCDCVGPQEAEATGWSEDSMQLSSLHAWPSAGKGAVHISLLLRKETCHDIFRQREAANNSILFSPCDVHK